MKESQPTACVFSGLGCRQRASTATCGDSFHRFQGFRFQRQHFPAVYFRFEVRPESGKSPKGKSSVPRMRVELRRQKPDHGTGAEHDSMSDADPVDILFSHKGTGGSSGSYLRCYAGRRWYVLLIFRILQKSVFFE